MCFTLKVISSVSLASVCLIYIISQNQNDYGDKTNNVKRVQHNRQRQQWQTQSNGDGRCLMMALRVFVAENLLVHSSLRRQRGTTRHACVSHACNCKSKSNLDLANPIWLGADWGNRARGEMSQCVGLSKRYTMPFVGAISHHGP